MPLVMGLTDKEAHDIAARVLGPALQSFGFDHVAVRSGLDHDGDPALFLEVFLLPSSAVVDADIFARAHGAVDDAFRAEGETRFPYFRMIWPDEYANDDVRS